MSKPSIPAWQRTATNDPSNLSTEEQPKPDNAAEDSTKPVAEESASSETPEEVERDTDLLAQASRFLEDPNIRDAPREKKAVFLQAKGVSSGDIETLLGKAIDENASPDLDEAGARAWSTVSSLVCCLCIQSFDLCTAILKASRLRPTDTSQISRTAVSTAPATSRNPSNRHISRIPCADREATAAGDD